MNILEYEATSATDLMEFLSPLNEQWSKGDYIFRGHGRAEYELIPSVCRRGEGAFAAGSTMRMFKDTSAAQVELECRILSRFLKGCDNSGLVVPGYSARFKDLFNRNSKKFSDAPGVWPGEDFYEVLAAAQHHGVPTRLLDWSRRSYVAAYFAATSSSFEYKNNDDKIAIWALDVNESSSWNCVKIIDPPGGTSKNLAAQSGVFTMQINTDLSDAAYTEVPLDDIGEVQSGLMKITMSNLYVPKLIELCAKFGVQGSTLFPGYEGVARDVVEFAQELVGMKCSLGHYEQDCSDFDINDHI